MRIKTAVACIAALSLCACASSRPNLPELPADSGRLPIDGASFAPPAGGDWYVESHTPFQIALVKPRENQDETIAVDMQLYKAPPPVAGKDFVQRVREGEDQDTDPKRFTKKVHDVTGASVGRAVCTRSYSVYVDHAPHTHSHSGKPMILESLALNCLHPDDPRVGVNLTYSERYYPGDEDPQFKAKARAILDSLELTKLKE